MKATLFALFVALLMVGCAEKEVLDNKTAEDGPSCEACADCCASEVETPSKVTETSKEVQEKAPTKVPNREVSIDELEKREGAWYAKGEAEPFTGTEIGYYEDGSKSWEVPLVDGKTQGTRIEYYKNGPKKREIPWVDGKQHGLQTSWYENGQKEEVSIYKEGKREGLWAELYEKGKKKFEVGKSNLYYNPKNQSLIEQAYASFSEFRGKADAPIEFRARCAFMMGECKFVLKDYAGAAFLYIETTRKFPSATEWVNKAFYKAIMTYENSGQSDQVDVVEKQYMEWQRKFLK